MPDIITIDSEGSILSVDAESSGGHSVSALMDYYKYVMNRLQKRQAEECTSPSKD